MDRRIASVVAVSLLMHIVFQSTIGAAPESLPPAKEVPRVIIKNLRMEGQVAGNHAIELPRKKFLPIDADLEAGTWGFTRTVSFQLTYVFPDGSRSTFPDQLITHPAVETDPCLMFTAVMYRGDEPTEKNTVGVGIGSFGNDVQPWKAKVRYWLPTPDEPGDYTLDFMVYDQEGPKKGTPDGVRLTRQKIVIR